MSIFDQRNQRVGRQSNIARDQNIGENQNSKEEFSLALSQLRQALSKLEPKTLDAQTATRVDEQISAINAEATKENPNKSIILQGLAQIEQVLKTTTNLGSMVMHLKTLGEMIKGFMP